MNNDAAWCRAMGKTLLRLASEPRRKRNADLHADLRSIAFQLQAAALVMETDDDEPRVLAIAADEPTQREVFRDRTQPGVVARTIKRG